MTDIFVSYASADLERVEAFVRALSARGWRLFWSTQIRAGAHWPTELEEHLERAQCVLVLWTAASIKSRWVRAEAEFALNRGTLLPVLFGATRQPLGYGQVQAVDLGDWDESSNSPSFHTLMKAIDQFLRSRAGPKPGAPRRGAPGSGVPSVAPALDAPQAAFPSKEIHPLERLRVFHEAAVSLNFSRQHAVLEAFSKPPGGIYLVYGRPYHGHAWITKSLISSYIVALDGDYQQLSIAFSTMAIRPLEACGEALGIRRADLVAAARDELVEKIAARLEAWLAHRKVIIVLRDFHPRAIVDTFCQPVLNALGSRQLAHPLYLFVLAQGYLEDCEKLSEGRLKHFTKLPRLTPIPESEVHDWYSRLRRSLHRIRGTQKGWLDRLLARKVNYRLETRAGVPEVLLEKLCEDFEIEYEDMARL